MNDRIQLLLLGDSWQAVIDSGEGKYTAVGDGLTPMLALEDLQKELRDIEVEGLSPFEKKFRECTIDAAMVKND